MNFFKSVFSGEPDHGTPPGGRERDQQDAEEAQVGLQGSSGGAGPSSGSSGGGGGAWVGFGGLMKTLASKSESVIQTYRRDLEEFGSGLRKETVAFREAIRDLPSSLEAGASVAQESLESVGQAIDEIGGSVWRGAAEIVVHGKGALLSLEDADDSAESGSSLDASTRGAGGASKKYSRFEAQVLGIQSDPATFTEEPEDAEDFRAWAVGFRLAEKEDEIERLKEENGGAALEGNLATLVPDVVDYETFWRHYFYRVHKLKQAEDVRANLVRRVISREEEEELSWEVDDGDDEGDKNEEQEGRGERQDEAGDAQERGQEAAGVPSSDKEIGEKLKPIIAENPAENSELGNMSEAASAFSEERFPSETKEKNSESNTSKVATNPDDQLLPEGKVEPVSPCKDRDVSPMSSQLFIPEEDDLGWDEIGDLGDDDEKEVSVSGGSPNKTDLRKRLSTAEEDEDLSWDIEDDEPINP